jgi:alcohol dehydrogenase class IV
MMTEASRIPRFEYAAPGRIIFGRGAFAEAGKLAAGLGRRALIVTGAAAVHAARLQNLLGAEGMSWGTFSVSGEPTVERARAGVETASEAGCDLVIGIGGGSALDTAKAIAALLANGGDPLDYLEVIGAGRPLPAPSLPCIAIPTTAGTGSEVTRNAVLAAPEHGVKASLRSPTMLPRVALVDPELTYTLPPAVTARTGLDALTQLIEPFVSLRANPVTDAFCREGVGRIVRSLRRAYTDGSDATARDDMALASLLGGLALGNAGLGTVHGFASVIGGMYPAPHGAVCAGLLPHVTRANQVALAERAPEHPARARYAELGLLLAGAEADTGIRWLEAAASDLGIPGLRAYGVSETDFATIIARTAAASSTRANPIVLTDDELRDVLERAL